MTCPQCGNEYGDWEIACPRCGVVATKPAEREKGAQPVDEVVVPAAFSPEGFDEAQVCEACGAQLAAWDYRCPNCGAELDRSGSGLRAARAQRSFRRRRRKWPWVLLLLLLLLPLALLVAHWLRPEVRVPSVALPHIARPEIVRPAPSSPGPTPIPPATPPPAVQPGPQPQPAPEPAPPHQPATGGLSDITVDANDIVFTVWDDGIEDGDQIAISVNGQVVTPGITITAAGQQVRVPLRSGDNAITVQALNEGMIPPNTAAVTISSVVAGRQEQSWELWAGETGTMTITVRQGGQTGAATSPPAASAPQNAAPAATPPRSGRAPMGGSSAR